MYLRSSAVALALLAGCAGSEWHKSGADAARLEEDLGQCRGEARLQAARESFPRLPGAPPSVASADATGRAVVMGPGSRSTDSLVLEQDLTNACMRGKGYELAPARPR